MDAEIRRKLPDWIKSLEDTKDTVEKINELPDSDKKLRLTIMYIQSLKSQLDSGDYIVDSNFNPEFVKSCNLELISEKEIATIKEDLEYINITIIMQLKKLMEILNYLLQK